MASFGLVASTLTECFAPSEISLLWRACTVVATTSVTYTASHVLGGIGHMASAVFRHNTPLEKKSRREIDRKYTRNIHFDAYASDSKAAMIWKLIVRTGAVVGGVAGLAGSIVVAHNLEHTFVRAHIVGKPTGATPVRSLRNPALVPARRSSL